MVDSFPFTVAVSSALGFLSGLGVGGGSLLMVWMTLVLHMEPVTARAINLLFFLPGALIASFFRCHQGTLPVKKVLPAMISGCVFGILFSLLSRRIDTLLLKKGFGLLLLAVGIRELFYRPRNRR